ncbi:high affinity cationic amino acid transporter 1-like [Dermacentor andersoni]|uniref:high affinity cationic amino acid transporter 1-like n=1 Tax=Dermacentor andersoni TaxID=34620 RepID=UPI002155CC7F|nr:cationic amino acid transporter 3-like [Dermacentor andersoni]
MGEPMSVVWRVLSRRKTPMSPEGREHSSGRTGSPLTVVDVTCLGVAVSLGTGVYVLLPRVAREEAGPAVVLSFLVAAVASCLAGLCYSELSTRFPKAGSAYVYVYATAGELLAFLVGWALVLEYALAACLSAKALSRHLAALSFSAIRAYRNGSGPVVESSSGSPPGWSQRLLFEHSLANYHVPGFDPCPDIVAAAVPVLLTAALVAKPKVFIVFLNTATIVNVFVLVALMLTGFFKMNADNWTAGAGFFPNGIVGVFNGAATCTFAFVGYDLVAQTATETAHRFRVVPSAVSLVFLLSLLGCFSSSVAVTLLSPHSQLAGSAPLLQAPFIRGLPGLLWVLGIGSLCGLASATAASLRGLATLLASLSADGLLCGLTEGTKRAAVTGGFLVSAAAMFVHPDTLMGILGLGTVLSLLTTAASVLALRYGLIDHLPLELGDLSRDSSATLTRGGCLVDGIADGDPARSSTVAVGNGGGYGSFQRRTWSVELVNQGYVTSLSGVGGGSSSKVSSSLSPCGVSGVPSRCSAQRTAVLVCAMVALMFLMGVLTVHAPRVVGAGAARWWLEALATAALAAVLALALVALRQPRHGAPSAGRNAVPCVPLLPLCALWMDVHLCVCLPYTAWLAFLVWQLLGVVVYMAYGVWHSSERQSDDPECSLLENVMCDDVSSDDVLPLAEQRREVLVETF